MSFESISAAERTVGAFAGFRRTVSLTGVRLIVASAVGLVVGCSAQEEAEVASSPDRNTATIVGTQTCLQCHESKAESYESSGHSRTLRSATELPILSKLDGLTYDDPDRDLTFHYAASSDAVTTAIPKMFGDSQFPLQYAFGSGQHAITFMTLLETPDRQSLGIEHRMSWFGHDDGPGETPQPNLTHPTIDAEFFGKSFRGESLERCFKCHSTSARIEGASVRDLRPNVGCESCHGAGSFHVSAVEGEWEDLHIDFASSQVRRPDEIQLCGKCHRTADMLAVEQLTTHNPLLVRFQPAGLVQSPCYQKSEGRLQCSTCHDPHEHASRRTREMHIQTCLECHGKNDHAVICSVSPTDKCISCHMPPVQIREGISFHDHWIRVRKDEPSEIHGEAAAHQD